jgi:hypothetical protein
MAMGQYISALDTTTTGKSMYLQDVIANGPLGIRPGLGQFGVDVREFDWTWMQGLRAHGFTTEKMRNVLWLAGQQNLTTRLPYDMGENFFTQVTGAKTATLLAPQDEGSLYPFPVSQPADRQSQILDVRTPNVDLFPREANLTIYETEMRPSDVLYIPPTGGTSFPHLSPHGPTVGWWRPQRPLRRKAAVGATAEGKC